MMTFKRLVEKFTPRPVEHRYDRVEQIGTKAVADALETSPTLEGNETISFPDILRNVEYHMVSGGGGGPGVIPKDTGGAGGPGAPSLLERHAAIATEAIDKFAADEQRLLETIRTAETDHAAHIAGLRQQLADTRTALRFYRTGPDMLKSRPPRAERPAKPKTRPTRRAQTKARKARDAVKGVMAPTAPRAPRRARTVPAAPIIDPALLPEKARDGIQNE